ncbi:MAG: ankyrin repeat domain-containing protein [Candidatus Amoebophilus sp.]
MQRKYNLTHPLVIYLLLTNLFFQMQSCGNSPLPNPMEENQNTTVQNINRQRGKEQILVGRTTSSSSSAPSTEYQEVATTIPTYEHPSDQETLQGNSLSNSGNSMGLRRRRKDEKGKEKVLEGEENSMTSKNKSHGGKAIEARFSKIIGKSASEVIQKRKEKENNMYALHEAIESMDIERIQALIEAGPKVNFKDINGNTALHLAIKHVDIFLNNYLQPLSETYTTPIFKSVDRASLVHRCLAAIKKSYIEAIARRLIELGTDINARNKQGETPLHIAVQANSEETIKLLSEKKAGITITDIYGNSPLHYAAIAGQLEIVELLIKQWGYDIVTSKNNNNETVLHWAAKGGNPEVVDLLIRQGTNAETKDKSGNSPLHYAAKAGQLKVVKLLIKEWCININVKNNNNESALHHAAKKGHVTVARFLIKKGITIDSQNKHGYNPLSLAVENHHAAVTNFLKEKGANIDTVDDEGRTPLHWAALQGHTALIKQLKEQGANIEARDQDGYTPLHLASGRAQMEAIKMLQNQGADIFARDHIGITAQQLIEQRPTPWGITFTYIMLAGLLYEFLIACMFYPTAALVFFSVIISLLAANYNLYRRYIRFYMSARNINILDRIAGNRLVRWYNSLPAILGILMLLYTLIMRYLG